MFGWSAMWTCTFHATGAQTKSPCPPLSSAQLSPTTRVPPVVTTDSLYFTSSSEQGWRGNRNGRGESRFSASRIGGCEICKR
uniref:Uncharacterized protein n=1 Tax=Aegilops tauschii subsp. strangulata TaxID=200361 RepID=A0A453HUY8_AEGTS